MVAAKQEGQSFNRDAIQDWGTSSMSKVNSRLSGTVQPRSFTSRHVPGIIEELSADLGNTKTANTLPHGQSQLHGLLAHLKQASNASAERQRQALATDAEYLVPEEVDQLLHAEFERRCCFGDPTNTEFMNSAKWTKMLKECGIIAGLHGFRKVNCQGAAGTVTLANADMVFQIVVHNVEYGAKRLTYELFCKALLLLSQKAYPDLDDPTAFAELLTQIAAFASAQLDNTKTEDHSDLLLDPNVVITLDTFKPALHDLFHSICSQKLESPMQARCGLGTMRTSERTYLKYAGTQEGQTLAHRHSVSSLSSCRNSDSTCEPSSCQDCGIETLRTCSEHSDMEAEGLEKAQMVKSEEAQASEMPTGSFLRHHTFGSSSDEMQYQVSYVNGVPVVRDRCRRMSIDQMMFMCTRLGIVPEFSSRLEVISIFKRAQVTGCSQSSLHGYLSYEEFLDAIGQIAIGAYSKQPFAEVYPEAAAKVEAFLFRILPSDSRDMLEKFFFARH